ncbi:hypothetical protein FACS1894187_15380 [Synergistales bacterium]|nr:hypothetical protein FACS1894187_15380 [Synergistales bacterium]
MPMIQVNVLAGHTAEEKRKFVADIARVTAEDFNVPMDKIWIQLIEMPHDEFAVGGKFISETRP